MGRVPDLTVVARPVAVTLFVSGELRGDGMAMAYLLLSTLTLGAGRHRSPTFLVLCAHLVCCSADLDML